MKLLYFTYDFPVPITSGGKNRAYHMLKYGKGNIDITLFSFYREIPSNDSIAAIESLGITSIRLFKRPLANFKKVAENPGEVIKNLPALSKLANPVSSITKKLYFQTSIQKELIRTVIDEKIDVVHFESLYTAYYFSKELQNLGVKQIFGTENLEYTLYEEYAKSASKKILRPIYWLESQKIKKDEHVLLKNFDNVMSVAKEDADAITQITTKPNAIIQNGVDIKTFKYKKKTASKQKEKILLFVGNFSYFPNINAIKNFYTQVFKTLPDDYILRIIGKDTKSLGIDDPNVQFVDYVEDIREEYYNADLFVFPIKIGGGTNFKVVESMACGLPIIGYGDRLETMGIVHKEEAYIVDAGKDFEKGIVQLMDKKNNTELMTHRARKFVEDNYSWEVIGEKLNKYWTTLQ